MAGVRQPEKGGRGTLSEVNHHHALSISLSLCFFFTFFSFVPPSNPRNQIIQKLARLAGTRDPGRGTHAPGLEVVAAGAEELVANVQRLLAGDGGLRVSRLGGEPALADGHAPRLVADVDEDVAAAVEGAEGDAAAGGGGGSRTVPSISGRGGGCDCAVAGCLGGGS